MREPGLAGRLDTASNVIRDIDRHEGNSALRRHDDRQAVREAPDVNRNFEIEGRGDGVLLGETRARRVRNITIVLRRRALLLAIFAAGVVSAARGEDAPEQTESGLPKFRFEAVLHDYEPVSDRHERLAEFFYGALAADWTRGDFAAKAEVRGRDGRFRPYYDGSVWLEEGWASVATPIGAVSAGKIPRDFGLADESFNGTLFSVNGVTRNPDWGAGRARGRALRSGSGVPARLRRRDGGSRGVSRGISHRHVSLSLLGLAVPRGRGHRAASSAT